MRLHGLEIHAFGPFPGREFVDFDHLTGSGLFLLCGPTGAGKTSVLDAVCFALFGRVPGDRDKARRLHSDHAAAGSGPRVVLEVSLRGRRVRVTRSPEWLRPKKRGTGEIREHAKVLVEERTGGEWHQRTNRVDEAGDLLGSLLGLTMSQFCQVALLPQGRFETFLRSGAHERHALLEKLFGTHRFRAVEDWLSEHRRALAAQSAEHVDGVAATLERVAEASGRARPGEVQPEDALDWTDVLLREALARLTEATQERAGADQRVKDARVALECARDLAGLQSRHDDAVRRDADLRALSESTDQMTTRIEQSRRAAGVQPLIEIHDDAGARLHRADASVRAARGDLPAHDPDAQRGPTDLEDVAAVVRRRQDEAARLEALRPVQDQVVALDTEIERVSTRIEALDTEMQRLEVETRDRATARQEAHAAHAAATAASTRLETLRERLLYAERVAAAAGEVPARRQRRDALARATQGCVDEAQRAREAWLDLRQARLEGMAAELARSLAADRPCPVCGSVVHPAPADDGTDTVSPEREHQAEQAWRLAEDQRQRQADALARCERDLAAAQSAAGGTEPVTADARLAQARAELVRAEDSAARADSLAAELARLESAAQKDAERAQRLEAERVQLTERRTLRSQQRYDLQGRLDTATEGAQTLSEGSRRARRAAELWGSFLDSLRDHGEAVRAHQQARARVHSALVDAGFGDLDDARGAVMSRTELSNTETLLRRRADQAAQVRSVLEDPRVAEAAAQPAVDLRAPAAQLAETERMRDAAVAHERAQEHRAARLERLRSDLTDALSAWRPVRASLAVAEGLAALCAGTSADNRHKMRLSAYVLAARLEQVIAAANTRLLQMSGGRYTLRHSVARGVGDRRGGLGLQVHDCWTGDLRDPATLSGGETFFTSLALALGLADVVSHEAGGTEIDTLFVDEGFGSLDPDTLEEVMDVLDQLRSGGRAVGIVSHVADLRARVPAQVHVRKSRAGSVLEPA